MKKKLVVSAVAGFLALAWGSVAAEAQVASFQGSTLGFSHNGDFKATGSSCPSGSPTQYQWTFPEEGVIRFGNPVTQRFGFDYCAYTVELKITCSNGSTATTTRFACFSCGAPGCINPDKGYN